MSTAAMWDEETETSRKQCPSHLRKGKKHEGPPSERIDRPDRRSSEDEIDQSKPPRCKEGVGDGSSGQREDGRAVKCDDVDAAHLLSNHDSERGKRGTPDARDDEQFDEASDVVTLLYEFGLQSDLSICAVEISRSL
jgi:hypothetical protein